MIFLYQFLYFVSPQTTDTVRHLNSKQQTQSDTNTLVSLCLLILFMCSYLSVQVFVLNNFVTFVQSLVKLTL